MKNDELEVEKLLNALLVPTAGYTAYYCRFDGKVLVADGAERICPTCSKPLLEPKDSASRFAKRQRRLQRVRLLRNHLEL